MTAHHAYSRDGAPVLGAFRMGLVPIDADQWLPDVEDASRRLAERASRLAADPPAHHACPPAARDAARELFALAVPDALVRGDVPEEPLLALGERFVDDFCLVSDETPPRLRAALLTAASNWRLADKLDRDLTAIHAPVEGLETAIGERMRSFFERLPANRIFERRNWAFYDDGIDDRSTRPALASLAGVDGRDPAIADRIWLRTERQTLRRLPVSRWTVFTIRIDSQPLTHLARTPDRARHLRAAMASLDDVERRARRVDLVGEGVDRWLRRVCEEAELCA